MALKPVRIFDCNCAQQIIINYSTKCEKNAYQYFYNHSISLEFLFDLLLISSSLRPYSYMSCNWLCLALRRPSPARVAVLYDAKSVGNATGFAAAVCGDAGRWRLCHRRRQMSAGETLEVVM